MSDYPATKLWVEVIMSLVDILFLLLVGRRLGKFFFARDVLILTAMTLVSLAELAILPDQQSAVNSAFVNARLGLMLALVIYGHFPRWVWNQWLESEGRGKQGK